MKKLLQIITLISFITINCFVIPIYAKEDTNNNSSSIDIDINDINFESKFEEAMNNPNIDTITTYDSTKIDKDNDDVVVEENQTQSYARNGAYVYRYRITNVKNGGTYVDKNNLLNSYDLDPNDTFEKTYKRSLKCKYSSTVNISAKTISTAVEFDVTTEYSSSAKITFTVPTKNGGKKVKYLTFNIYPKYKTKTFTIQRHKSKRGVGFGWNDYGSGYARQLIGFSYHKDYHYK